MDEWMDGRTDGWIDRWVDVEVLTIGAAWDKALCCVGLDPLTIIRIIY